MIRFASVISLIIINIIFTSSALSIQKSEPRMVTVTGNAEVQVVPDEVTLVFGVETWNKDLDIAKKENDERIQKIIAIVKQNEIDAKHIQTDYLSIEPRYESYYKKEKFIGYFMKKSIVITLKDTSRFETILSQALKAGANYVHDIKFRTTELRKHRDQARSLAIKAAQEKAKALAQELGQKIGDPYRINENSSGWHSWYNSHWGSRWGGSMAQNVISDSSYSSQTSGSIALGHIKINSNVSVSFELK